MISDPKTRPLYMWAGGLLILGTVVYHWLEGWGWLDSLYFCVISLTTVGYGDFTPDTVPAKLFTVFYVLNGVGILLSFLDTLAEMRRKKRALAHEK